MVQDIQRIAVIGAGIAGLASAYCLSPRYQVTLFESAATLGGHANTVDITVDGQTFPVDSGFLVYNDHTYPNLIRLLAELGVDAHATEMSFSVSMPDDGLEWAGTNLDTVFAQRRRLASPAFLNMLREILLFNRAALTSLAHCEARPRSLRALLDEGRYGALFRDAYLVPMAAAIWSSSPRDILDFPAATFLRFCLNHGLLQIAGRPQWRTVRGGSRRYVQRIAETLPDVRLATPVASLSRREDGKVVLHAATPGAAAEVFDAVVVACHAPQALAMLADASQEERAILSAVRYQANRAFLHTDASLMPRLRKVWSSWNYLGVHAGQGERAVCVSYWLNRLQNLPCQTPVMLTLNPVRAPAAHQMLAAFDYEHPVFDQAAIDAQQALPSIQGRHGIWFAGAWTGYGFHEDGLNSALSVAADLGCAPAWAQA